VPTKPTCITDQDYQQLQELIKALAKRPEWQAGQVGALSDVLQHVQIVNRTDVPKDLVTMNTRVRLRDLGLDESEVYTLVDPSMADPGENRISVAAPCGAALLGRRRGDVVEWMVPRGIRRLLIEAVLYQPERAASTYARTARTAERHRESVGSSCAPR
jgi:regulator of nucleoside diphosphate kinase